MNYGAVVIGRDEGERLKLCLRSLSSAPIVIYVDSNSSDGSPEWARKHGVDVIEIGAETFTAAAARNLGRRRLKEVAPNCRYVFFVDGDCEVSPGWAAEAISYLNEHADIGAVAGQRRERHPERSVYNWLCDREWRSRPGEVRSVGGDSMMRLEAFDAVGGFREALIAGEEPELCVRLRAAGWRIWKLAVPMTVHDAAITKFSQWWRRIVRSGYAFAEGAHLHGGRAERHWVWETCRAWMWGAILPGMCLCASIFFFPWGIALWMIYPLQVLRQISRNDGSLRERATIAFFQALARFPEAVGQMKFWRDRILQRRAEIIEYK